MSELERRPRELCRRYASTLALLDDLSTALPEREAALDHLAGCRWCQADQRADAQLAAGLRRAFGPDSPALLSVSDLLAAIDATSEPVAPTSAATRPPRLPRATIHSVIELGNLDDMERMERMDESEGRNGEHAAQSRRLAPIPSLRPGPHERAAGRQRWAVGFGATAAAVALVVVAVTLFASRGRAPGDSSAAHSVSATATAHAQLAAASEGSIGQISMDSPTDGWALGQLYGNNTAMIALYHFDGSRWALSPQALGTVMSGENGPSIQMVSPTDGWVLNGDNSLHYDGTAWRPITFSLSGGEQVVQPLAMDMLSPTEGWMAASLTGGASGAAPGQSYPGFLRYDGRQWTADPAALSLPGIDPSSVIVTGISALPGGDVWAVGTANVIQPVSSTPTTTYGPATGLIFHRVNGVWQIAGQLNSLNAPVRLIPNQILMTSPTAGWIIGYTQRIEQDSSGATAINHALLLRYDFHQFGTRWVPVTAPIANPTNGDLLNTISANGQNDIWVSGTTAGAVINAGMSVQALLLHFDGSAWTQVTPSLSARANSITDVGLYTIAVTSDGTLWGAGFLRNPQTPQGEFSPFICSFSNGAWSIASIVTK